jgi:hypothetical protein
VTSEEKSTWPGESIKLIKNLRQRRHSVNILIAVGLLGDILDIVVAQLCVKGDGSGFNGDASVLGSVSANDGRYLLILTSVRKPLFTGLCSRNDSGSLDKRVGQSGLSMIDMGNDTSVRRDG